MEELIKNFLFYTAIGAGTTIIICLLICGTIRVIGLLLDHLKIANTLREAIALYIKSKNPIYKCNNNYKECWIKYFTKKVEDK